MDVRQQVMAARRRIGGLARRTPLEFSHFLSEAAKANVYLKLENFQRTGSFKLRGALNKLSSLNDRERAAGVVAASTGNHGAAVACAGKELGCSVVIFVPDNASRSKLDALQSHGAETRRVGSDCLVAESGAREYAESTGKTYVSPYNDPLVIAGQGTIGAELEEDLERIDAVLVSVGGGGLISGVGGYLKQTGRDVEVVGCSPRNSAVMHASLAAGRILDLPSSETLSDGTAGGVEAGSITFDLCRRYVDRFVLVTEEEIAGGVRAMLARQHLLVEGAAGAAVAAFLAERERYEGRTVVVLLCGANIDPAVLKELI